MCIVSVAWRTLSIKKQDYGFDYSDGDGADDAVSVDVENMYYTAKCLYLALFLLVSHSEITAKKEESPEQALKEFASIVDQDDPMSDWYIISTYQ